MANILYLREMGMNDNSISTDIKNHRVRVIDNIDIEYKGNLYNMFFEFGNCTHRNYRTTNKRTGAPLKKSVVEIILEDGLHIDTQFERTETNENGYTFELSYRQSALEEEIWNEHRAFTRSNVLEVVNRYKVGEKFDKVVLVEEETKKIINKVGGLREKEILGENKDFQTEGDSYMEIGETWNDSHKVVKVFKRNWKTDGNGRKLVVVDSCAVDLVSGRIVG